MFKPISDGGVSGGYQRSHPFLKTNIVKEKRSISGRGQADTALAKPALNYHIEANTRCLTQ
jgi:hypothetical protein